MLLIGPTGTGKSHLAQALGHRACRAGHCHIVDIDADSWRPKESPATKR